MTATQLEPAASSRSESGANDVARGLGLCIAIALCSDLAGAYVPLLGAPLLAILLGVAVGNVLSGSQTAHFEVGPVSRWALKCGIVLLGATLNLRDVLRTGASSILVLAFTVGAGMAVAFLGGQRLAVGWRLRSLIGIGTTICGASAIAALAPVVRAKGEEIAYAISVVFLFNMVAVIAFPLIGHLFGLSAHGFGLWAGTAINDTSAVVAAGFAYGQDAGNYAAIVKLTRTTLIVPLVLAFGLFVAQADAATGRRSRQVPLLDRIKRSAPWFIGLFLAASMLNSFGVTGRLSTGMQAMARLILLVALAGVGLQGHWRAFTRAGLRPIALGLATWAAVAVVGLLVQRWMGQL